MQNFLIFARIYQLMRKPIPIIILLACFLLSACQRQGRDAVLVQRSFYNETWERFDYVYNMIDIKQETTYDLSMRISFTEAYPYEDFSMIFTVFDAQGNPYRSRGYKFKLKDAEGNWNSEKTNECYTFVLPINKELRITEPGTYRFQIEYRMPKTPIYGVKELTLFSNK